MPDNQNTQPTGAAQGTSVPDLVKQLRSVETEMRFYPATELRANLDKREIHGFIPYDSRSVLIYDYYTEIIEDTAFLSAINGEQDHAVRSYWGHSPMFVLGKCPKTQTLTNTDTGMRYVANPPPGDWADSLLHSIDRGDVDESSFGFRIDHSNGDRWERDKKTGAMTRFLVDVMLHHTAPVADAAYKESKVSARSILMANEIDPEKLAQALDVSDAEGVRDPELRQFIVDTSRALSTLLGGVQLPPNTQATEPPSDEGRETNTEEEIETPLDAEAQARTVASALEPYHLRLRLLEMEGASNA
ncbi:MAG: hypothetical protein GY906_11580 [bacterium]|nr:hypothetical protein [bacterium]